VSNSYYRSYKGQTEVPDISDENNIHKVKSTTRKAQRSLHMGIFPEIHNKMEKRRHQENNLPLSNGRMMNIE
jgi:hypothetical protein